VVNRRPGPFTLFNPRARILVNAAIIAEDALTEIEKAPSPTSHEPSS
jgi:hypothetical protein